MYLEYNTRGVFDRNHRTEWKIGMGGPWKAGSVSQHLHWIQAVSVEEIAPLLDYSPRQVQRFANSFESGAPGALDGLVYRALRRGQRQFQLFFTTRIGTLYYQQGHKILRGPQGEMWIEDEWGPAPIGTHWQVDQATIRRYPGHPTDFY